MSSARMAPVRSSRDGATSSTRALSNPPPGGSKSTPMYFWKFTDNAFDFGTCSTPDCFSPFRGGSRKSMAFSLRVGTTDIHGFQAYTNVGHTRARYFGPSNGGLISIRHSIPAAFSHRPRPGVPADHAPDLPASHNGPWIAFTWRYDRRMVAGAVGSLADALALTAAQQAAIGFYCGGQSAPYRVRFPRARRQTTARRGCESPARRNGKRRPQSPASLRGTCSTSPRKPTTCSTPRRFAPR